MKVFISVDIEGCAGITHWDEARRRRSPIPAHGGFLDVPRTPVLEITDNIRCSPSVIAGIPTPSIRATGPSASLRRIISISCAGLNYLT